MDISLVMIVPWLLTGKNPHYFVLGMTLSACATIMGLGLILLQDVWYSHRGTSLYTTLSRRRDVQRLHQGYFLLHIQGETNTPIRRWSLPTPLSRSQAERLLRELTGMASPEQSEAIPPLLRRVSRFIHSCAQAGGIGPIHRLFTHTSGLSLEVVVDGGRAFVHSPEGDAAVSTNDARPGHDRRSHPRAIALLLYRLDQLQDEIGGPAVSAELFDLMEFVGCRPGGMSVLVERYIESPSPAALQALAWMLAEQARSPRTGELTLIYDFLAEHWETDDITLQINCLTTVHRQLISGMGWPTPAQPPLILLPFIQRCLQGILPVQLTALDVLNLLGQEGVLTTMGTSAALERLRTHLHILAGQGNPLLEEESGPLREFMGGQRKDDPGLKQAEIVEEGAGAGIGARQSRT